MRKKTQMYLFTTRTCPNCRIARECLKDVDYQIVDAQEHPELARQFGVMQAPTLVLVRDKWCRSLQMPRISANLSKE